RTSFASSYVGLPSDVRRSFRLLGLLPGPDFSSGPLAAQMECEPAYAEQLLEQLAQSQLIEAVSESRYRFHDLLRLYAAEQLEAEEAASDREAGLRRMLDWYLDTADVADRLLVPGRHRLTRGVGGDHLVPIFATHAQALAWME